MTVADRALRRRQDYQALPRGNVVLRRTSRPTRARPASPTSCSCARTCPRWCGWSRACADGQDAHPARGSPDNGATVPWVEQAVRASRSWRGRMPPAVHPGRDPRRGLHDDRGVLGAGGRTGPVHARGICRTEPARPAIDPLWAVSATEQWWSGPSLRLRRSVARAGGEVADHAQGAGCTDRRADRRRAHDLATEEVGGERNWDYRYCWLRDASLTLEALMIGGEEVSEFASWLLRATAGPLAGEHHVRDRRGAHAARAGARLAAGIRELEPREDRERGLEQFQLDIYGELMDAATSGARSRARWTRPVDRVSGQVLEFPRVRLEGAGRRDLGGVGPRRYFTHSKVMAGCVRPRGPGRGSLRCRGAGRPLAGYPCRDSP